MTASMFRDIERGAPIEAEQILGDLLRRSGQHAGGFAVLRIAFAHLQAYEARRSREAHAAQSV
jgi:2-dehydropantoate 2-reductase